MSIDKAINNLQNSSLIILYDDLNEGISYLVGDIDTITNQNLNFMIKEGKGLIYACISKETANQLSLNNLGEKNETKKQFVESVDYYDVTTGISVSERVLTLKKLACSHSSPADFNTPGHIFPIISTNEGLLNHRNIAEAILDLLAHYKQGSNGYACEILDHHGQIADKENVQSFMAEHDLSMVAMSELLAKRTNSIITSFDAELYSNPYVKQIKGFPNLSVSPQNSVSDLTKGVYGVMVEYEGRTFQGIMHINQDAKPIYDIYLFNESRIHQGTKAKISTKFFLRNLRTFDSSSIDGLVSMYERDTLEIENLFHLLNGKGD